MIPLWLQLNEVVATGAPQKGVNQQAEGGEFFRNFVTGLFNMNYPAARVLAEHLPIDGTGSEVRVLDLAAGSGVWGIALAQRSERVRVTAVDWPQVIPTTQEMAAKLGLASRFSFVPGDLLQAAFGSGYNVATLGHILHSEGQERSRSLLEKTFHALASGGTIAIGEFLVNKDRTGPLNGLLFAVNMLVATEKGDTYSFEEISGWLSGAGFVNMRTLDCPGPSPLILATKP
jgi:ubiquinone/menaquinone biosynthesis C-methylase UbiE